MTEEELKDKIYQKQLDEELESVKEHLFVLEGKNVVPCKKLSDWGKLINNVKERTVAITIIDYYKVSTVFIGYQGFDSDEQGRPLVFETMIFNGDHELYCDKYGTWEDAEKGHEEAIKWVEQQDAIKQTGSL